MNLVSLLDPGVVKVPVESIGHEEVIAELVELLVRAGKIHDREGILDALYDREAKGSTGIGSGVAIPHARHPEITDALLAVGIAPGGIEFDAVDEKPVYLVFLLMGAPDKPGQTVEVLADIGILVQIPGITDKLVGAGTAADVLGILEDAGQEQ